MTTAAPQPAKILIKSHDRPPSLDNPRSPRKRKGGNFEKYAWLFMRFSGIILVFLVIGHMAIMLTWDSGVHRISAEFVKERWSSPGWQIWDLTMLWLAQLHGERAVRDLSRRAASRPWRRGSVRVGR